jgi:hypothetical protein
MVIDAVIFLDRQESAAHDGVHPVVLLNGGVLSLAWSCAEPLAVKTSDVALIFHWCANFFHVCDVKRIKIAVSGLACHIFGNVPVGLDVAEVECLVSLIVALRLKCKTRLSVELAAEAETNVVSDRNIGIVPGEHNLGGITVGVALEFFNDFFGVRSDRLQSECNHLILV